MNENNEKIEKKLKTHHMNEKIRKINYAMKKKKKTNEKR